jgi:hypothetical protein
MAKHMRWAKKSDAMVPIVICELLNLHKNDAEVPFWKYFKPQSVKEY